MTERRHDSRKLNYDLHKDLEGTSSDKETGLKLLNEYYLKIMQRVANGELKPQDGAELVLEDLIPMIKLARAADLFYSKDDLTATLNRKSFLHQCAWILTGIKRPLSLLFVDVDHFKKVNDIYGHRTGDVVLKVVADRLSSNLKIIDPIGRYGGDEFAVGIVGHETSSPEGLHTVAERIRQNFVDSPIAVGDQKIAVTVSIGGYANITELGELERALDEADNRMYESKRGGRNITTIYNEQITNG